MTIIFEIIITGKLRNLENSGIMRNNSELKETI